MITTKFTRHGNGRTIRNDRTRRKCEMENSITAAHECEDPAASSRCSPCDGQHTAPRDTVGTRDPRIQHSPPTISHNTTGTTTWPPGGRHGGGVFLLVLRRPGSSPHADDVIPVYSPTTGNKTGHHRVRRGPASTRRGATDLTTSAAGSLKHQATPPPQATTWPARGDGDLKRHDRGHRHRLRVRQLGDPNRCFK